MTRTAVVPLHDRVLVTKAEAAQLAGVSPTTLRAWTALPGFPLFTPPGTSRPMIPVAALRQWIEQHTQPAGGAA